MPAYSSAVSPTLHNILEWTRYWKDAGYRDYQLVCTCGLSACRCWMWVQKWGAGDLEISGVPCKLFIIRGYTKLARIIIS